MSATERTYTERIAELEERLALAEARIRELYFTKADDPTARDNFGRPFTLRIDVTT